MSTNDNMMSTVALLTELLSSERARAEALAKEVAKAKGEAEQVTLYKNLLHNARQERDVLREQLKTAGTIDANAGSEFQRKVIVDLRKEVKTLETALAAERAKQTSVSAVGTMPMAKNPNRAYIEGVAYQHRAVAYRKGKTENFPVATVKVFRDDDHAEKFLKEHYTSSGGRGQPARLGAVIVECENAPTPEAALSNRRSRKTVK